MRARKKFDQHWVVVIREPSGIEYHRGPPLIEPEYAWKRVPDEREREAKHGRTVHVVKVTRYRLAPLVELPAWEQQGVDDYVVYDNGNPRGPFARYARFDSMWVTRIGWMNGERFPTADEARAACESRLRELGYRVAKAVS